MIIAAVNRGVSSCVTDLFPFRHITQDWCDVMSPEDIMLCRVSQTQKDKYHMFSLMCGNLKLDLIDLEIRKVVPGRDS